MPVREAAMTATYTWEALNPSEARDYVAGAIATLCEVRVKRRVGIAGRAEQVAQQESALDEEDDERDSGDAHPDTPRA
jgi:hypothetical protein